ncbi:hypothetical protein BsIDN1_48560 [Bacillus safensis]|uniref:MPN domain-containing protein n=1 Tax=Bacillus safensis TaxID=561879 RepID=A0A5S9ME20_BACIA|nr:hypothetical protein BsIDN1_48560 [Bacillus safensis]
MSKIRGVGKAKAVSLLAALELGTRLHHQTTDNRYVIRTPEDGAKYVMEDMRFFLQQENFVCLYLNSKNQVLHKHTVFIGSLNSSIVHPREIFSKRRLNVRLLHLYVCTTIHPSGDPTPSREEDIEVTQRLFFECGKLIGIQLLDHLVIGDQKFVSLKEKGYL